MSIYSSEHFESKIERNENVADKVPEDKRVGYLSHIDWAKNLASRLDRLDPEPRDSSIMDMIRILDADYASLGLVQEQKQEETKAPVR